MMVHPSSMLLSFCRTRAVATVMLLAACTGSQQSSTGSLPPQRTTDDRITLPPVRKEWQSPGGTYLFAVSTPDNWRSFFATGELFSLDGSSRRLLWSAKLAQRYGPRFVLVSDSGTVLMLDEWMNVTSPYAVVIVDRANRSIAQHSTDAVQAAVQVPLNRIVELAVHGPWISAPPRFDGTGERVLVGAGGKTLIVRLSDGALSVS